MRRLALVARGELADMDRVLSRLLRWMVRASMLVLVFGLAVVALTGFQFPHRTVGFDRLVAEVLGLRRAAILDLGLLLLIAVPPTRVAVSLVLFARRGDRAYAAMTALVLGILLTSLLLGITL